MSNGFAVQAVEIGFIGPPPTTQISRASGVSRVEVDGSTLRCLVEGSFQPFLEALRGHEVLSLVSTRLDRKECARLSNIRQEV